MRIRLSNATLRALGDRVAVPNFDRRDLSVGIVHLGVGGFHRAHEEVYLDSLMGGGRGFEWAVRGIGVLARDRRMAEILTAQDGLYTLIVKHPDGQRDARVIGSLTGMLYAPDDPAAAVAAIADPRVRIVSMTITEGGYLIDPVTGEFQADHPSLAADREPGAPPRSVFALVTAALAARRARNLPPFTVLSCDNVPSNGDVACRAFTGFARLRDPALADWMEARAVFPNSMVDRVTPVTTEADRAELAAEFGIVDGWPVVTEPFSQWVLEDRFPTGRPDWESVGVQMVNDVEPYELMKLRLLNAGHQVIAYLGTLAGFTYTYEVCQDPAFRALLEGYLAEEGTPTVPPVPGIDLEAYRRSLLERFANQYIADTLARLGADTSDRIPKFLLPVVRYNLAHDGPIDRAALVVAAWARYAEGVDDLGRPIEVVDPLRAQITAAAARQRENPVAFLELRGIFGDLADQPRFVTAYLRALESLHVHGARATVEALVAGRS